MALLTMEAESNAYHRQLGVEAQPHGFLKSLLSSPSSQLVNHTVAGDSVRGFYCQDRKRDIDAYLRGSFVAVWDSTGRFRSLTCSTVEQHNAMLRRDVSSIIRHLESRSAALASEPSVMTSSDSLGTELCRSVF